MVLRQMNSITFAMLSTRCSSCTVSRTSAAGREVQPGKRLVSTAPVRGDLAAESIRLFGGSYPHLAGPEWKPNRSCGYGLREFTDLSARPLCSRRPDTASDSFGQPDAACRSYCESGTSHGGRQWGNPCFAGPSLGLVAARTLVRRFACQTVQAAEHEPNSNLECVSRRWVASSNRRSNSANLGQGFEEAIE